MHTNLTHGHTTVFAVRMNHSDKMNNSDKTMTLEEARALAVSLMGTGCDWDGGFLKFRETNGWVPRHLWMMAQMYLHGKKLDAPDVWGWAEHYIILEGYDIDDLGGPSAFCLRKRHPALRKLDTGLPTLFSS